ncbi:MAG: glyoxalase [Ectothiorhodospiraceae bacterium]|nr:glyoxalase [Ectothiorhodospiraceae bacterium]
MSAPIIHFEVLGKDDAALHDFYRSMFGWEIDTNNPFGYGFVMPASSGIAGGIGKAQDGPGHVTVYAQVDDVEKALEKAQSLGGKTIAPAMDMGGGTIIGLFADPEGHIFGVVSPGGQ